MKQSKAPKEVKEPKKAETPPERIRFIRLTLLSGPILINPKHITFLQDLGGSGKAMDPQTHVMAGQTLFVMESVEEILEAAGICPS